MSLNTLEQARIERLLAYQSARIKKLEDLLQGVPIRGVHIADLTWDKSRGGTAVLGGAANGNGILEVKDDSDVTKIILDKDGILINDGKLIIQNEDSETVVDSKGIVSTNGFRSADSASVYSGSSVQTITRGSGYNDLTSSSLTFSLDRDALVLILAEIVPFLGFNLTIGTDTITRAIFTINFDSTDVEAVLQEARRTPSNAMEGNANVLFTLPLHYFDQLAAGSHTVKLRANYVTVSGSGTESLFIYGFRITYIILGT